MTRIYLIDDHQLVREGLRGLLELAGHEVVGESANAVAGVHEVLALSPDILLLDLTLADESGLFCLAELQRRHVATRTIVLTMSTQLPHLREARKMGARGYVLKGSSSHDLLKAIDTVVAGGFFLSTGMVAEQNALHLSAEDEPEDPTKILSIRERQIMELVVRGKTSAEIAALIFLSPKTVETYRSRLMRKLEVNDLTELVRLAVRQGIL